MSYRFLLLAVTDTIWTRLAVCGVFAMLGVILIFVGLGNIRTRRARETGRRRRVNRLFGESNTYRGSEAVKMGWMRVIMGICAILFGIIFLFVGPFLAR